LVSTTPPRINPYRGIVDTFVQLCGQSCSGLIATVNFDSQFNEEIKMKLSQMYRAALIATTMLMLSSALDVRGFAQSSSPQGVKNIVLVHGAWADGSCWSKVIALLQAKSFHVVAVQNPLTSLADDVATTKRIIALQDGPVILVGHSYAGVVITEAGNDPKVVGLVYVAAFAPGDGESINSVSKPYPPAPLGSELRPDAQGFLTATPKGIAEDMAQDLPASEQRILTATQGQTSSSVFGATITKAAWKSKPSWALIAGNDRAIPPELEKAEAAIIKATSITVPANHLAMLSHPKEVAELIEQAAAKAK
jgi:pimeloyl-ACP methyl ester carboxylesterase